MAKPHNLTLQAPWIQRFMAWIHERFPLPNALLFFILYLTTVAVVYDSSTGDIFNLGRDVLGCLVTWSFFLLLRIFDEHKDYELDCQNHPQRVLQSGLITLNHLKIVGAVIITLEVAYALFLDQGLGMTLMAGAAMFIWTCLMGQRFCIA